MINGRKKIVIASGLSNSHIYLIIIGNTIIQKTKEEYGYSVIIKVNVELKTMIVTVMYRTGEKEEIDKRNLISNGILDLSLEGDRWEGDVLDGEAFGWGKMYDKDNDLIYEGFAYKDKYVCYGTEFYKNSSQIRYSGMYYNGNWIGYGKLYDRKGNLVGMGCWMNNKHVEYCLHTQPYCEDKSIIHSMLQVLIISKDSYNHPSLTRLSFRFYPNLRKLVIGSNCCQHVVNCTILGMKRLRTILIGSHSFRTLKDSTTCQFICKKCPVLMSIIIKKQSFTFYSYFSLCRIQ